MGLAASQARLLMLTSRQSDLELKGQIINQRRLKLAYEMEQISSDYTEKISDTNLYVQVPSATNLGASEWAQLDASSLASAGYTILYRDADGKLGDCDSIDK
ncbi:MAG: hypothetical protein PHV68_01280, partial [Candidatus Gastranaerophilales bacterium]|nr:hypothetical protein [Candidatus Gastranaerophilales bacterium]